MPPRFRNYCDYCWSGKGSASIKKWRYRRLLTDVKDEEASAHPVLKEPGIANTRGSFLTSTAVPSINHQIDHPHVTVFAFVRLLHHHLFSTRFHAHGLISCGIVQGQIGIIPGATFWHVIRSDHRNWVVGTSASRRRSATRPGYGVATAVLSTAPACRAGRRIRNSRWKRL